MRKILRIILLFIISIISVSFIGKNKPQEIVYITKSYSTITINEENYKELNKKLVAFTFDDGPNKEKTSYLLKELEKRNAHVSFFMVGNRILGNEYLVKEIFNAHHTIGNHTYDHKNLKNISADKVLFEINETNKVLEEVTGHKPIFLRPPYGTYNNFIKDANMTIILWSIDTEDWLYKDAKKIKDTIVTNVQDGDIILLHDLYDTSIEGALLAMDELKDEYRFVSIEELIKLKGINVQPNEIYHNFR